MIDAHHHLWTDPAALDWLAAPELAPIRRPFGAADLRAQLSASGVTGTVLVENGSTHPAQNAVLFEHAERTPEILGVVAWAELDDPRLPARLAELRELPGSRWLRGVRAHLQDDPDPQVLHRPEVRRGLATVAESGLVFDLLLRADQLAPAADVAASHPELSLVLDHLGKPPIRLGPAGLDPWRADLARLAAQPNVTAKLSGLVTEADWASWRPADLHSYVDAALDLFGPDRLMFGSDWPVCTLAAGYPAVRAALDDRLADLPPAHRQAILTTTAHHTYALPSTGEPPPPTRESAFPAH